MTSRNGNRALSLAVVFLMVVAPLLALVPGPVLAQDNLLNVTRTQDMMTLDGVADEEAWSDAIATTISTEKGEGQFIDVDVRALYDSTYLYMTFTWADPSKSIAPHMWNFTAGNWANIPNEEDRLSLLWNTDKGITGFEQNKQGCWALQCHEDAWATWGPNEVGDLWQWMSARTNPSTSIPDVGWMDDLSINDTAITPDDFTGSNVWAENSLFAHDDNASTEAFDDDDKPMWMEGNAPPNPNPNFLFRGFDEIITDHEDFEDGTLLPGYLLAKPSSGKDRADIAAKGAYDDIEKEWTLEIKRKLVTDNDDDVQFDNLLNSYHFGLAVFNNRGAGFDTHYNSELVTMRFEVPEFRLLEAAPAATAMVLGDEVNVSINFQNMGGYSTGFTLGVYLDNMTEEPLFTKPYTEFTPGLADEFNYTWDTTGVDVGKHTIIVMVDSDEIIPERDETNNVIETEVWVYPPIKEFTASKKDPEEGKTITLTATIENPSDVPINLTVAIYEGDFAHHTDTFTINGSESYDVTFEWKAEKAGKHKFRVEIDNAPSTAIELTVDVKEESPTPGALMAVVALAVAASLAAAGQWRRRS